MFVYIKKIYQSFKKEFHQISKYLESGQKYSCLSCILNSLLNVKKATITHLAIHKLSILPKILKSGTLCLQLSLVQSLVCPLGKKCLLFFINQYNYHLNRVHKLLQFTSAKFSKY